MLKEISDYPKRVGDLFERYKIRDGVNEIMNLARVGNKYFNDTEPWKTCLLYTSDAADERSSVDLGGRRIIKKNKNKKKRKRRTVGTQTDSITKSKRQRVGLVASLSIGSRCCVHQYCAQDETA